MKKIMAVALATMLVIGCSFSAWAGTVDDNPAGETVGEVKSSDVMDNNYGTVTTNNGSVTENRGAISTNNNRVDSNTGNVSINNGQVWNNWETVDVNNNHIGGVFAMNGNHGVVGTNAITGTIDKNWGTITTNNGTVGENVKLVIEGRVIYDGTVTTNNGTVTTNNGTIETNGDNGSVITNNGIITENKNHVDTNNNTVTTNNGEVTENKASVTTNYLTGEVTNDTNGTVYYNYGTVNNAALNSDGELIYGTATYYGVTYGEGVNVKFGVYKNIQSDSTVTSITILTADEAGASREGYKLVGWKLNTSDGSSDATTYAGGDTYVISMPVWFEAVWEKLSDDQKKGIIDDAVRGGSVFTSAPTSRGSASAPVTSGTWNSVNDRWTYMIDGEKLVNCTAWLTYTDAQGQTAVGKFCFDNNGYMLVNTWKQVSDGVWNYFGADGKMLTNTTTPDGYFVDANGEWRK